MVLFVCALCGIFAMPAAHAQTPSGQSSAGLSSAERQWVAGHPSVRVGYPAEFPPYYFRSRNGGYEGFVIDLLDRVADISGLKFELHPYASFPEVLAALEKREIDLTPFAVALEARKRYAIFPRPMFATQLVMVVNRKIGDIAPSNGFGGYRVAVDRQSAAEAFVMREQPATRLTRYDNAEQALLDVADGKADIYVGYRQVAVYYIEKHLLASVELRGDFSADGINFGPAVRKDLPELARIIEHALDAVPAEELSTLAARWLPVGTTGITRPTNAALTPAEMTWVARQHGVRVGYDAAFAPITFRNGLGGFDGLAADLTRLVLSKSGLALDGSFGGSFAEAYQAGVRHEVDLLVASARNPQRRADYDFVGPFMSVPTVIVMRADAAKPVELDALPGRRLALLADHFLLPSLRSRFPAYTLLTFDTQDAVLQAVIDGAADAAIGNAQVVNELLQHRFSGQLVVTGVVRGGDSELYYGVRRDMPELGLVLRKSLDAVSDAEMSALRRKWLTLEVVEGVRWTRLIAVGAPALLVFALVFGFVLRSYQRLREAHAIERKNAEAAKTAAQDRADFIAYLSHEMRGPLAAIHTACGYLAQNAAEPMRSRLIAGIFESSRGLVRLFQRSLDFERIARRGGVDLRPQSVNLAQALQDALDPLRLNAELKHLEYRQTIDLDLAGPVMIDDVRLTQVLQNIVGNAIKFTEHGSVEVIVGTVGEPDANPARLRIRVTDTGPGMSEAEHATLFRPYAQGAAGEYHRDGAGLGLPISLAIVTAMHGSIDVSSTPGAGACFTVTLPLEPAPLAAPAATYAQPVSA